MIRQLIAYVGPESRPALRRALVQMAAAAVLQGIDSFTTSKAVR